MGRTIANFSDRRAFIGGSDARIIMGADEAALLCLWREKRGEAEPEDLSGKARCISSYRCRCPISARPRPWSEPLTAKRASRKTGTS